MLSGIEDFFMGILWGLCRGIMWILDCLHEVFNFLAGVTPLPFQFEGSSEPVYMTFLDFIFGTSFSNGKFDVFIDVNGSGVHTVYYRLWFLFAVILVLGIIYSIFKIQLSKEDKEMGKSIRTLFFKSIQSVVLVLIMPVAFTIILTFCGLGINFLGDTVGQGLFDNASTSIGTIIGDAAITTGIKFSDIMDASNKTILQLSYADIKGLDINWFLLVIGLCGTFVGVATCVLVTAKRIIKLILNYLYAPLVIATIPVDDGGKFNNWKEATITSILTVSGYILVMYIFLFLISIFNQSILENLSPGSPSDIVLSLAFIVIIVAGAFATSEGGSMIATFISASMAQNEQIGNMSTGQMLGQTMRMAGAVGGLAAMGAKAAAGGGSSFLSGSKALTATPNKPSGGEDGSSPASNPAAAASAFKNAENASNTVPGKGSRGTRWGNNAYNAVKTAGDTVKKGLSKVGKFGKSSLTAPGIARNAAFVFGNGVSAGISGVRLAKKSVSAIKNVRKGSSSGTSGGSK